MACKFEYLATPGIYSPCIPLIPTPNGLYFYAIGNTPAFDLTEDLEVTGDLDILLLGCGDIRNVLKTSSGYATRGTHSKKPRLHFHMCDFDLAVLARNAVLLEIITEIDPSFDSDMQFIWNVWYNLGLTEIQHQRLCKILDRLCENPFKPRSMSNIDKESTLSKLKGIWLQWRKVGSSLVEMKKIRAEFLKGKNVNKAMKIEQLPVGFSASNVSSRKETMKKQLEEELAAYVKNGTSFSEESLTHPNPTLFRSSIPKYEVHYASNPFESYDISDEFFIPNTKLPFTSQCKNILALWITQFKSCSVSVTLAWMDAFQKCLDCFSENTKFDFIDCSNVGDHDSMLGIMVSASLVLKPGGFLFTGTMLWATLATSLEKYLEMIIGISYYMIPTILGLKLGVDVDLGSSAMISLEGREIRLIWKKIQHSQSPTSLSQGDLLSALLVVFQKCFGLACFDNGSPSAGKPSTSSTVATSILILKHIVQNANLELRDTIEILQRYIPQGADGPFDLAWKCALAQVHVPEFVSHDTRPSRLIQVMLDMQLSERYKHLITGHGSVRLGVWIIERKFGSEDCIKLLIEGNINCVADLPSWAHIISNASFKVREGNVLNVSFVMTREDYETYRFSGTVFVYEDGILSPLTTCSEELKKARIEQVDFNEAASGTCPMRNDESRKKLILLELSETINGYEAVITFPKTAKGTLQTEFKLGNSLVALSFSDIKDEKIEIRLSCAVKPDTSHFKIHRTKGFVECKLLKDKELTFGAGVLPYTEISFTELPPFSREKVPYIMGDMFRGKWMSKMQNSMPGNMSYDDPYLNMKESIQLFGADYAAYNKINVYNMIFHDKTIDFIVYVKRFCCYKKHPMIWVKIVDMFYRGSLLKAGYEKGKYPSDDKMIKKERDKFTKALAEGRVRNIICSKDESLLLRRWLRTNAFRVAQDPPRSPVPIWIYDSFITLLYPYVHFWEGISEMVQHQNYENFLKMVEHFLEKILKIKLGMKSFS